VPGKELDGVRCVFDSWPANVSLPELCFVECEVEERGKGLEECVKGEEVELV
jgi:hypothetical protein